MKSIAVITDTNARLANFLRENLEEVLGNKISINNYFLNTINNNLKIDDEIVLVMIKERAFEIKKHIKGDAKVIVIKRTIEEEAMMKIFSIPKGTDVLVVNDNKETTYEIVSFFYELGINHINLVPYYDGRDYSNFKVAITPGESKSVPTSVREIIDVGDRKIDVSTFIKIISFLDVEEENNKLIHSNLIKYSERLVNVDIGVRDKYKELFLKNEELDTIINLSNNGIIFTSLEGKINICNEKAKKMLGIYKDIIGKNINDILDKKLLSLLNEDCLEDEVIEFNNKFLSVNKCKITSFGLETGIYYHIQEITYIRQLEQNLSKKIREKGHIARYNFNNIITNSKPMQECIELALRISLSDLTVLILGESGTGKELFAQSIHNNSLRNKQPFIAVNCAAMPENLLESELFGYEAGAFTGALKEGKKGLFEQANNGTIFLDEIGDMPLYLQTKLLRVLQERQLVRVGSNKVIDINIRVIAATNQDLFKLVNEGKFRGDLYYRLNVLPLNIPPLNERKEDILDLLIYFMNRDIKYVDPLVKKELLNHTWPGNVRELQNLASYLSLMCNDRITINDLPYYFNVEQKRDEFDEIESFLENKYSFKIVYEILKEIEFFNSIKENVGRNNLVKILSKKKYEVTENEIRKILVDLSKFNLVVSGKGRKGSSITEKGKEFLKTIKNR
ncbi:sigma-54 interaction domain-containing protein [Clostridium senegalense]|uniref:sigma-54 interaction domain-containing protein n=1 Tax=Clostridium senegalense TaxID=1465809 RepID=UPI00028921F0|nr:sigma 54-interacting transcriptional regulator [Clostridium senegalense]